MVDGFDNGRGDADPGRMGTSVDARVIDEWFVREIIPLERLLMHFLNRALKDPNDAADLRQDVYVKIYEAAQTNIPDPAKPFLMAAARNLVVDRIRHKQVVSIETVGDLERLGFANEDPGPDRIVIARSELSRLRRILDQLPERCREAMILRKVECLPRREIAQRMGISEDAVAKHLAAGMRVVADTLNLDFGRR